MGKYKTKITEYGYELINNVLSSNKILITNGWHIALGTGELEPDFKTTRLNNIVFDKNSADYPGIIISKCNKGRYAEIVIPESLAGMVITEIGLFDEKNGLVACANTKLDCTERTEEGFDIDYRARIDLGAVDSDVVIEFQGGTFQLLEEKGEAGGYAPLDDKKKVPLKHLQCPYIPFCFNSGAVDENGNAALLELSMVTEMAPPESDGEEPGQVEHKFVTLKAPAVYTDGNGKTVNITENLTLDVTDSEPGKYSLRVAENNGIIEFFTINAQVYKQKTPPENPVNGDLWQNLSVAPSIVYKYDAASQEWLPNCNEVEAGTYTVTENSGNSDLSGGGGVN